MCVAVMQSAFTCEVVFVCDAFMDDRTSLATGCPQGDELEILVITASGIAKEVLPLRRD